MNKDLFTIGAKEIDAARIMAEIEASVQQKIASGAYDDARIARAERTNLAAFASQDEFVGFYLRCLRDAVSVDIGDYEIHERRSFLAPLLVSLKKIIWKLLKFYTYRLWSQQNEVNALLLTAVENMEEKYERRLRDIERRLDELSGKQDSGPPPESSEKIDGAK